MAKFIDLNRKNGGCPLCGRDDGACRQNADKPNQFLCISNHGEYIGGFKYSKETTDQRCGIYWVDNGDDWKQERENNYQEKRAERIARQEQVKKEIADQSLSATARDKEYKKLFAQLDINQRAIADLTNRGLSIEFIKTFGFKSVAPSTQLISPINPALPGTNANGKGLILAGEGFLIPCLDINKNTVAWQVRLFDVIGGKYRWSSSEKSKHWSKEFGEPPLQHAIRPENKPGDDLFLVEGLLKPWVASERLGLSFLGAAGGQFLSSKETLKHSLNVIKPGRVILTPDAGSLVNNQVLNQYRSLYLYFKSIGYDLYCLDYGQGDDKANPDIDELTSLIGEIKLYESWDNQSNSTKPEPEAEPLPPLDYKGDVLLISSDKSQADIYLSTGYIGSGEFEAIATELKRYRAIAKNQLKRLNKTQLKSLCKQHKIKNYSKLNHNELLALPELNALDLASEEIFDKVSCTIKIKIDHPNRLFIANQINKINTPFRDPDFIPYFSFDKLPDAPYIKAIEWEQNHPEAVEQTHKKDLFELWKNLTTFTPDTDKIDHVRYIGDSELFKGINLLNGRISMLSGGLGGGKTTDFLTKAEAILGVNGKAGAINPATGNPIKILVLSYRINLLKNTAAKAKQRHINGVIEMEQFKNKYSKWDILSKYDPLFLFACVDSLPKICERMYDEWWKDFIIVFDEADAVVNHTEIGSTCRQKRNIILNSLDFIMKNCLGIYALSGTLNDTTKDFFAGCDRPIDSYQNTYQGKKRLLQFCLGEGNFSQKTKILDLNQRAINESLEEILRLIGEGENLLIISDSQKRIEEIEQLINDNYDAVKSLRIDALTRQDDTRKAEINKIMADPSLIYKLDYQVILFNSSAESGIDITFPIEFQKYFKKIFCYSFSVIGCNGIIQLLRRYRHECEVFLWSSTSSKYAQPVLTPDAELWQFMDDLRTEETEINLEGQPHQKHILLKKKLDFISAYEQSNPRICLVHSLEKHGYKVDWHYLNESDINLKEQREKVETRRADNIFNAGDIHIGKDLSEIQLDDSSTLDEYFALKKAHYIRNFGYSAENYYDKQTPLFTPEIIRTIEFKERQFFKYVRNSCYFDLPEEDLKLLQRDNYRGNTYLGDINLLYAPMHSLHRLHIEQLLNIAPAEEGKQPFINLSDKYFDKVQKWSDRNPEKWELLCGSKPSERYFIFQLKKIIKKYFGVKSYVKENNLYLIYDPLNAEAKPLIAKQIDDRIFKIKTFKYLADNTKYPEVTTDPRFAEVAKNFVKYEHEDRTGDDLVKEIREQERAIAPVAVVVEQTQQQQPGTEPEPIPQPQPAIAPATINQYEVIGETIVNPADVATINGINYLLGEVVKVNQPIGENTSINLPAGLGCRILYNGLIHIATAVNDAEIIYKNDFDYWCIAYNPHTTTARRYNGLL